MFLDQLVMRYKLEAERGCNLEGIHFLKSVSAMSCGLSTLPRADIVNILSGGYLGSTFLYLLLILASSAVGSVSVV